MRPLIIGIAGGSGSGKTYLAKQIAEALGPSSAELISMDQYFKEEPTSREEAGAVNFDHPSHLDFKRLIADVGSLRQGRSVWVPTYDFLTMKRVEHGIQVHPKPIILVEGLFILADPMVSLCDLTCFLDVEADERLLGRILRDIKERDTKVDDVIDRYQRFVRPSYQIFVAPTKQNADVIVDFTFRRSFFTQMFIRILKGYLLGESTLAEFVEVMRSESYQPSLHPEDGFMPLTTDIFKLAKAYPDKASVREIERPLASPAATSFGSRTNRTKPRP